MKIWFELQVPKDLQLTEGLDQPSERELQVELHEQQQRLRFGFFFFVMINCVA